MKRISVSFVLSICMTVSYVNCSWAQSSYASPDSAFSYRGVQSTAQQNPFSSSFFGNKDPRSKALQQLNVIKKQLTEATERDVKSQLESKAKDLLAEYFNLDMTHRSDELSRLEERASKMESLLTKREDSKADLVDLQLKSYQYETQGLGLLGQRLQNISTRNFAAAHGGLVWRNGQARDPRSEAMSAVNDAVKTLRDAESNEEGTDEAVSKLRVALGQYFDKDLEHRHKELKDIQKDLSRMASRLKKRETAKDEVVKLQLQLFVNEAEGLGFFGDSSSQFGRVNSRFTNRTSGIIYPTPAPPTAPSKSAVR